MRAAMFCVLLLISLPAPGQQVTHDPILGLLSHQGVEICVQTDRPGAFLVRYGTDPRRLSFSRGVEQTRLARDNTGWVHLQGLRAETRYFYRAATEDGHGLGGSFRTLPHAEAVQDDALNPGGLFHFSFAFACGPHNPNNHWYSDEGSRPATGPFQYGPVACDIRWSTFLLNDIPRQNLQHPTYCVAQINNVFDNPQEPGQSRWVAFPRPQVIFQYYQGMTGKLLYAESILACL